MNEYIGILIFIFVIGTIVYLLSGNIKRTLLVIGGWGTYDFLDSLYNLVLWPIIQNSYGFLGVIYLTLGAVAFNLPVLYWYQRSGVDWLGVNSLEEIKEREVEFANKFYEHKNKFVRFIMYVPVKLFQLIVWLLKKNDIFAFVAFSLINDSFITTAFLRHGKFGKLTKRDYFIFAGSTFLGCFLWGFFVQIGLQIIHIVAGWLSMMILLFH